MTTYLAHLATNAKILSASPDLGLEAIKITPGTYALFSDDLETAKQHYAEFDELMEPNAAVRIYEFAQDPDEDAIRELLERDVVLGEEQGAKIIEERLWDPAGRVPDAEWDRLIAETLVETFDDDVTGGGEPVSSLRD